jgi:hypothetical protein
MIQRHPGFLIHHDELRRIVSHWKRFNAVVIGGRSNAMPASFDKRWSGRCARLLSGKCFQTVFLTLGMPPPGGGGGLCRSGRGERDKAAGDGGQVSAPFFTRIDNTVKYPRLRARGANITSSTRAIAIRLMTLFGLRSGYPVKVREY